MILGWARRHFANPSAGIAGQTDFLLNKDSIHSNGCPEKSPKFIQGVRTGGGGKNRSYNRGSCTFSEKVRQSQTWDELKHIWNEYDGMQNSWHAERVLLHSKTLPNALDEKLLDEVVGLLIKQLSKWATPRQVVGALHALGKIRYTNSDLLDGLVQGIGERGFPAIFPRRDIVVLIYALGAIESRLGRGAVPALHRLVKQMAEQIVLHLDQGWHRGEYELANMLMGLGQLGVKHEGILSAVNRLIGDKARLSTLRPYGLVQMFYRASQLGLGRDAMDTLVHELTCPQRLSQFKGQALSTILFTFAYLDYKDTSKVEIVVNQLLDGDLLAKLPNLSLATMCYSLKRLGWKNLDGLDPMFCELSRRMDRNLLRGLALCNTICGLSHMGCKHQGFWKSAVAAVLVKDNLSPLSQKGLTGLLCGFLTAGVSEGKVYSAIMYEFVQPARLKKSSEQDLVNFLCSISLLPKPNEASFRTLVEEVERKASAFSDKALLSVLLSLEKSGLGNALDARTILGAAMEPRRLRCSSEDYLAKVAYSLGGLNVRSKGNPWVGNLLGEVSKERRLCKFSIKHISQIMYAVGKIRRGAELVARLVFELNKRGLEQCSDQDLSNIVFGLGGLSFPKTKAMAPVIEEALKPNRIYRLSMHTLVTMLLGLAKLSVWKDQHQELVPIFDRIKQRSNDLTPEEVSKVLHALACIGCLDLDLVEILADRFGCEKVLTACSSRTLSTVIHSLSELNFSKSSVWEKLWNEVGRGERIFEFSCEAMSNVLVGLRWRAGQDAEAVQNLESSLVGALTSPARLTNAPEVALIKTLECMVAMEGCSNSNLQALVTEISKPGRANCFGTSDRVRIVRSFSKIQTRDAHTFEATNKFLDALSLSDLHLFSVDHLVEFVECANSLPNPSAKLVNALKSAVGARKDRLGRKTVSHVAEMMGKVNPQPKHATVKA